MREHSTIEAFRQAEELYLRSLGIETVERVTQLKGLGISGRYLEAGDGPPLVLLHGGGGLGAGWAPLMVHLSGFRLIAPDRPGFGLTEFVDYRSEDLRSHAVQFLRDLLDAAEVEQAAVVANSMGALWTLWFAEQYPSRVSRLVLQGTPALILDTSAPAGMHLLGVPGLNRLLMRLEPPSSKQVHRLWQRMGHDPRTVCTAEMAELTIRLEQLPDYKAAWLTLLQNVLPYGRLNRRLSFTEASLREVTHPVLYIWGSNDPFGSLDVARRAQAATPDSELELIGVGHLPWLDEPEACGRATREFLKENSSTG